MSLKQSIVVVNEYTIKNSSGKGGSRGGTPGDYVTRYMARNGATETLTPVRATEQEDYIKRYMARESAVERIDGREDVKPEFRKIQKYGGVAFSRDDVSLSDERLEDISKDIQSQFDSGKTVLKTVISFDQQYLQEMGIVSPDFECENAGDYRGNIDQMKLRMGIQSGMERLSRSYDDLEYVGVLQVDTQHVHCHLAMVDKGRGHIMPDGTQRGKLTKSDMMQLRRGIDLFLDDEKEIQHMASNVDFDKRNTKCFVKQVSHKTMENNGMGQFVLACLPDDKRLWRASTNDKRMRKANSLMRDYVRQVFSEPDSGYDRVRSDIYAYAKARQDREDLSSEDFRRLVKNGERKVEDECINSVYSMLSGLQKSDLQVRTPMLDVMSAPSEDIASDADELEEFGYKLKSYSSRLQYHKKQRAEAKEQVRAYEQAEAQNAVSDDSRAIYEFFKFEQQYQEMCMCKYQHFLGFIPPEDEYEDELQELLDYREKTRRVAEMYEDRSIKRMKPERAEDYGLRVYEQHGGQYMTFAPDIIEQRRDRMQAKLADMDRAFADKLTENGIALDEDGKPVRQIKYDFEDVKHLDIHHIGYDSPYDIRISKYNIDRFSEVAETRQRLADEAMVYLYKTGQQDEADILPMTDIRNMSRAAKQVAETGVVPSLRQEKTSRYKRSMATRLDVSLDIDENIRNAMLNENEDDEYGYGTGRRKF